jgi:hypothetical protein
MCMVIYFCIFTANVWCFSNLRFYTVYGVYAYIRFIHYIHPNTEMPRTVLTIFNTTSAVKRSSVLTFADTQNIHIYY